MKEIIEKLYADYNLKFKKELSVSIIELINNELYNILRIELYDKIDEELFVDLNNKLVLKLIK